MKPTVVVCDDDPERVVWWADRIRDVTAVGERFTVLPLSPLDFAKAYAALKERKAITVRDEHEPSGGPDDASVIDDAAILVVDYDLTPDAWIHADGSDDDESKVIETELAGEFGETFAYLARCYSRVGTIVIVNQRVQVSTFDLTMRPFVDSFADLNVSEPDIDRATLWTGVIDGSSFRPWHWPPLLHAPDRFEQFADAIDLDEPVLGKLGLDSPEAMSALSIDQTDFLSVRQQDVELDAVTFRQVAEGTRLGLIGRRDKQSDDEVIRRIAAAGVLRWLERVVLPAQNALIDAPHAVERYPVLLGGEAETDAAWASLARLDEVEVVLAALADLSEGLSPASQWLSRPVWLLPVVSRLVRALPDIEIPNRVTRVFCEDVSAFYPVMEAQEFTSAVTGPYRQRFIRRLPTEEDVDYRPRNRLLT